MIVEKLAKHAEFLSASEVAQCNWAEWLVEQVLCGGCESHIELSFAEDIEELLLLTQGKVWWVLRDGYMRYEYGEIWAFDVGLWRCLYGDSLITLPLESEVVIIDRNDILRTLNERFKPFKRIRIWNLRGRKCQ